jgi:hypothetical protein
MKTQTEIPVQTMVDPVRMSDTVANSLLVSILAVLAIVALTQKICSHNKQ